MVRHCARLHAGRLTIGAARMQFGCTIFPTADTIDIRDLARRAEDIGLESLFVPEHTHIPAQRTSVYAPEPDAPLAPEFAAAFDPFIALTAAAAVTERIRLGTGLCLIAQRDPIILAKEVASLDVLSAGRVELGVGPGWNREEMRNHGLDPSVRHRAMEERVEALRVIWSNDEAEYHGEHVDFDPIRQGPKPVQTPGVPILIGGSGPKVLDRAARLGDGWLASAKREDLAQLRERIAAFDARAAELGRAALPVSLQRPEPEPHAVEEYERAGVARCIFGLPNSAPAVVREELAAWAALIRSFA